MGRDARDVECGGMLQINLVLPSDGIELVKRLPGIWRGFEWTEFRNLMAQVFNTQTGRCLQVEYRINVGW